MHPLAMMMSRDGLDSPLARTFAKARWLLVYASNGRAEFRRNDLLSGGSIASAIAAAGCRDVIAAHLGSKAHDHLLALGVRVWRGSPDLPVRDLIALHARGELPAWHRDASENAPCTPGGGDHGARRGHDRGAASRPDPVVHIGGRTRRD
jgi:predicted Fe-Mo cluster-binding NifX family protein